MTTPETRPEFGPETHIVAPLATDAWRSDLDQIKDDMKGAPINVHKLMAHNPDLLKAWWDFRNHSVGGGTLGPITGELVILRVAVHLGSWYEWASHVDRAVRLGMPPAQIKAVLARDIGPEMNEAEGLVLRAVDDLLTHRKITDPTRAALEAHFSTAQIMDIIAIQGMYQILGSMIATWGLPLDTATAERLEGVADYDSFIAAAARFNDGAG
ncbi:MAG: carboxymuconolactone decarboxylase family protein [Octadecabacter sp.]|nr:carboxymuconolactone decarboxylase family protein [Octadecabacter sp.]